MKYLISALTAAILLTSVSCSKNNSEPMSTDNFTTESVPTQTETADAPQGSSDISSTSSDTVGTTSEGGSQDPAYTDVPNTSQPSKDSSPSDDEPSPDSGFIVPKPYIPGINMDTVVSDYGKVEIASCDYRTLLDFASSDQLSKLRDEQKGFALTFADTPKLALAVRYDAPSGTHRVEKIVCERFEIVCDMEFKVAAGGIRILKTNSLIAVGYDHYMGYYYVISADGYIKLGSEESFGREFTAPNTDSRFIFGEETYSLSVENGILKYTSSMIDRFARINLRQKEYLFLYLSSVAELDRAYTKTGRIEISDSVIKVISETSVSARESFDGELQSIYESGFSLGVLPAEDNVYTTYEDYLTAKENNRLPSQK